MTTATSSRPSSSSASHATAERQWRLVEVLANCPLLFDIPVSQLDDIAKVCTIVSVKAQEHAFLEGEPCRGIWVIAKGRVRLYHADAQGRQQVVSFRGPHYPLELAPALDGRPHTANAMAMEDCELVFVPRATMSALATKFPVTIRNMLDQLCLEVRQRDIAVAIASLRDARGRVGCTILQMARQYGSTTKCGTIAIDYRLTRQDIADRSGVTLETSIRVLSDLQRRALVSTRAQYIEILNLEGLRKLCECGECELDCSVFAKQRPRPA